MVWSHLPLHHSDSYRWALLYYRLCRWLIIDVIPLQQGCAMLRLLVVRQIVAYNSAHVEIVRQLECKHRVIDFARAYLLDILLRAHGVGILMIVRYSATKHDCLKVQLLAQFLAILIHTTCQTHTTIVGMYKHLDTIKNVSVWIVSIEGFVACNLSISVVALHHVVVNDD